MAIQITCVRRVAGYENPYEGITHVGWVETTTEKTGTSTVDEMIRFIEQYGNQAVFVEDDNAKVSYVAVESSVFSPRKTLRTYAGEYTDDLLKLPDCEPPI